MIVNQQYRKVVSNLGWVDKGNLWIYDLEKNDWETVFVSSADYLGLFNGDEGFFSILSVFNDSIEITVHHFRNPAEVLSKLNLGEHGADEGDINLWKYVRKYYVAGFTIAGHFDFHLLKVEETSIVREDDKIDWYRNGNFDFMYQGLTSVTENNDELIFSVQRDGSIHRFSLHESKLLQKINLAGNSGNPYPHISNDIIWAVDYDTLVQVSVKEWRVIGSKKLQDAEQGTAHFIGDVSISSDENLCIIPRPFTGDVIALNKNLKLKKRCVLGRQPLEAVAINNEVIARDWKTGDLLLGKFKRLFPF